MVTFIRAQQTILVNLGNQSDPEILGRNDLVNYAIQMACYARGDHPNDFPAL